MEHCPRVRDAYGGPIFDRYFKASPFVLIDAGASGGVQASWKGAERHLQVVGFEPDPRSRAKLAAQESRKAIFLESGLYKQKAEIDLYLTRVKQKSSPLPPYGEILERYERPERYDVVGRQKIAVDTLDSLLAGRGLNDPDFIKIDIQGGEYDALLGARSALENSVIGLEIEAGFVERYKGQGLFSDIDMFLRPFGFELFDLRPYYSKRVAGLSYGGPKGQIIYSNVVYFRNIKSLRDVVAKKEREIQIAKVLKMMAAALVYGYIDYAIDVVHGFSHLFSDDEKSALQKNFDSVLFDDGPGFRGKRFMVRFLRRLAERLEKKSPTKILKWYSLGNRSW